MKLLQKDPEKRYQTGYELVHDLEALLETSEDWKRPFQTPGGKERSTSTTPSGFGTSRSDPGAPPHTPGPQAADPVEAQEEEATSARETGAPRPETERATSRRFQRRGRLWKYVAIAGGAGGLIASLVFVLILLLPGHAPATRSAGTHVFIIPPGGPDTSPKWFESEGLLAMSEWGEKMPKPPVDQTVPFRTLPGQKVAPCDRGLGEVAIYGNCWTALRDLKPPCGRLFHYEDACYRPIAADPKKPVEPGPDRLRAP